MKKRKKVLENSTFKSCMAMSFLADGTWVQHVSLSEQVSKTLQALTSRPGVESTLILSREDGSIIKVAGFLEEPSEAVANNGTISADDSIPSPHAQQQTELVKGTTSDNDGGEAGDGAVTVADAPEAGPTRAERFASEIFNFVVAASSLASSLRSTAGSTESGPSLKSGGGGGVVLVDHGESDEKTAYSTPFTEHPAGPDDLQLLRMRTKKHEVIIFPDSKFLCCVVQNLQRQGNR